ncbi:MAG TPA: type II toxin-antitoxin system Phd/YefM family antitoxin [Holophagaceae bacterium]|nr:type II toxin-antitoxin system Phd/YefM family antitoxin [Holophagaceae bacterium]
MNINLQPVTEVKRRATEIIAELQETKEPVVITQHGRAAAVLMDIESYETLQRRLKVLMALSEGRKAVAEGRVHSHEEVAAEFTRKYRVKG